MRVSNRVGVKIEGAKLEPKVTIEMNLNDIKSDYMKSINSLDIEILPITSNKPF